MKKLYTLSIPVFLFCNLISAQQGVVGLEWARHHNVSDSLYSSGFDVDAHGCVYVCGVTQNTNTGNGEITVIKYSQDGELKWSTAFTNPGADLDNARPKLKIGGGCSVFVGFNYVPFSGATNTDIYVVKFDSTGNQHWVATYNGPGNDKDSFTGLAFDNQGNTYVSGSSYVNGTNGEDFLVIKYNSAGQQQWAALHNGLGNGNDAANSVAVDNSGNVYATGFTYNASGNTDYTTIRYNSNGTEAWAVNFDGQDNLNDYAAVLKVDISGNIVVTGSTQTNADAYDFATLKYNSSGVQQWVNYFTYSLGKDEIAVALATDNNGNIFVTGNSGDQTQQTTNPALSFADTIITIKYSSAGIQQWAIPEYFINTNPNIFVIATASTVTGLVLDALGNAYIAGYRLDNTFNIQTNQQSAGYSFITVKYNQQGTAQWKRGFTGTLFNNPQQNFHVGVSFGLSVPKEDTVYVAGGSINSGVFAITTVKFSPCTITADAGQDATIASGQSVQIGNVPLPNLIYSWSPVDGLDDPIIANPIAIPTATTSYVLTVRRQFNSQCLDRDTVVVTVSSSPGSFCTNAIDLGQGDTCANNITMTDSVMWFKFVADSGHQRVSIQTHSGKLIDSVEIYEGTCNGLAFFANEIASNGGDSSITVFRTNFIVGNSYFVKIYSNNNGMIDVCSFALPSCNCPALAALCNYILNPGFENGPPLTNNEGGVTFGFAASWSGFTYTNSPFLCTTTSGANNSVDLFDVALLPFSSFTNCVHQASGTFGIPINEMSNGSVNVRIPGTTRYAGMMGASKEAMQGTLSTTLQPILYYLEFYYAQTDCAALTDDICIGFSGSAQPFPLGIYQLNGGNPGQWLSFGICIDASIIPNLANMNSIWFNNTSPKPSYVFDDFRLFELTADAGADVTVACGGCTTLGSTLPCSAFTTLSYSWSPSAGLSCSNCPNPVACPAVSTTYTLTVTDPAGFCMQTDMVTVTVPPALSATASGSPSALCNGGCSTLSASVAGGTAPYTYSWMPSTGLNCTNCPNPVACPTVTTNYSVIVTDANGCSASDIVTITVGANPVFTLSGPNTACTPPNSVYCVSSLPAGGSVIWSGSAGINFPTGPQTSSCLTLTAADWGLFATQGGIAQICATVTDANGCSSQQCITVNGCCQPTNIPPSNQFVNATINTTPTQPYIGDFSVNGTLTIGGTNTTVTFYSSNLIMGPNALIIVQPTCTLNLVGSACTHSDRHPTHLYAGCGYMWRGIRLMPGTTASIPAGVLLSGISLAVGDAVLIEDADSAVVSVGNNFNVGQYNIANTWFNKNYKGIVAMPFTGINPSLVLQSVFTSRSLALCSTATATNSLPALYFWQNYPFATLLPPHGGFRGHRGVEINQVAGIVIGVSTQSSFLNYFDNLDYGVYSSSSKIFVYNNQFQNMSITNLNPVNGIGVFALGNLFFPPASQGLTVGGMGANEPNKFKNCAFGVFAQNFILNPTVNIINNNFNEVVGSVGISFCPGSTINITDNKVQNNTTPISYGVFCADVFGSSTTVFNNSIFQSSNTVSLTTPTLGIAVQNVLAPAMNLVIQKNKMVRLRTGISLVNISGSTQPLADDNDITFTQIQLAVPPAQMHSGIRLQGCNNVHVKNNRITKTGQNPSPGMVQQVRGISVENSSQSTIGKGNKITKAGSGIYCDGNDNNSILGCNDLISCYNGFFFNSANIGTQQLPTPQFPAQTPTANKWINNTSADKMFGSVAPSVIWYYRVPPIDYNPNQSTVTGLATIQTNNPDGCSSLLFLTPPPPTSQARQALFGAVVNKQEVFIDHQLERSKWSKKYVYRELKKNQAWMNLNAPDDSTYQNFFSANLNNAGNFEKVNDFIALFDSANAMLANNSIIPADVMEINRKTATDIYINSWMQGKLDFSSQDSSTLLNIAMQNPIEGGDGVYSARVMLRIDPDNMAGSSRLMMEEMPEDSSAEFIDVKLYPNPASDEIFIELPAISWEQGKLEIYSVFGKNVLSYDLHGKSGMRFNIAKLEDGVYMCRIVIDEHKAAVKKLVILKNK